MVIAHLANDLMHVFKHKKIVWLYSVVQMREKIVLSDSQGRCCENSTRQTSSDSFMNSH